VPDRRLLSICSFALESRLATLRRSVHAKAERFCEASPTARAARENFANRLDRQNYADMVSHLLSTRDVSAQELDELEQMVRARRKKK